MVLKRQLLITITGIIILLMATISDAQTRRRILVDTDVDTDDVFALFYLLKQNKSEFDLQGISINTNGWSDGGHAVNHVYDMLYMMDRDDIPVGVGGEGAFFPNSTIFPNNVGGYLPLIDQGTSTAGGCRYRQAIPVGRNGRLDVNTNFGLRRSFLPQGERRYVPLEQPTAQQVIKDAISSGPITIFLMGSHTNLAIFLMTNPGLKRNIQHIYAMGGSIGSTNMCGDDIGNLFPQDTNPFAEFNIFADPLAAYVVLHSGIPITLVPLDATKTIPVDENFFSAFEKKQETFEARYCFQSLKMARDTWMSNEFYKQYCMWDSFMVGVALSQMRNNNDGMSINNEFALMEYVNITVVTSNEPYGISDGSNPLIINGSLMSNLFGLINKTGVHSGHVQLGMQDHFCLVKGNVRGKCQDGYTKSVIGEEGVKVLIAKEAKPNSDNTSSLAKEFYKSFLDFMNRPEQKGRFNMTTQFPYYREILNKRRFGKRSRGNAIVLDMDMSTGDFLALLYLLKLPVELVDTKGILISGNGWANAATIDVVYDILHMMGRDDIPVGLGNVFAIGQSLPNFPPIGDYCAFTKYVPQGAGGFLDSDTLYGLARHLPRSPRTYTAENSIKFGAPRETDHPEHRQPTSLDVWKSVVNSLNPGSKVTVLTNGPLTNLAQIIDLSQDTTSLIQDVYIVGGHISKDNDKGNLFTFPSNKQAEFNIFLDPLAAKKVLDSNLSVTLIPLRARKQVSSFRHILNKLDRANKTPEAEFARRLILTLKRLKQKDKKYSHVDTFLGEILGAVVLASDNTQPQKLGQAFEFKSIKVLADQGDHISKLGEIVVVDEAQQGKRVRVLESLNPMAFYGNFADVLGDEKQSAVIGSYDDQKRMWSEPPKERFDTLYQAIEVNILVGSIVLIVWIAVCCRNRVTGK